MYEVSRVQFLEDPKDYFIKIREASAIPWSRIAQRLGFSTRTVTSWRLQETTIPLKVSQKWEKELGIALPRHKVVNLDEQRREAGVLGGMARQILYGNLGTSEGRRRGGLRSWQTHKKNPHSPFVARKVFKPKRDAHFAELVGAILGDGTVTAYQLILYSNIFDEVEYSRFLADLITKVFRVTPTTHLVKKNGVIRVVCSRTEVVGHLKTAGVGIGNKVRRQAGVPVWVQRRKEFAQACLRGLVDTDGCVYLDRHHIKWRDYTSLCIAFTNASEPLLDFVFDTWESLGFNPTRHGRHVRLRRREEVLKYAKEIGFSNPKHTSKIQV